MVLAVCRYQLRDPQAAEDAAQETFLSAHRSLLGGTRPRDPGAWLATIARNQCHKARQTARPVPLDDETAVSLVDPADVVAHRADLSDVAGAIAGLPDRQREALVLREFCGLSYEQVAAAMSVSGAAVDSLLSRARRRLVEQLGDIPRAASGVLVVPASLRDELAQAISGLGAGGAGAGGAATIAGLGSAPVAAKIAATGAAALVLTVPLQTTLRGDQGPRNGERPRAAAKDDGRRPKSDRVPVVTAPAPVLPVRVTRPAHVPTTRRAARVATRTDRGGREHDNSGPGSGSSNSGSGSSGHGSGETTSRSDSSGPGPGPSVSASSGRGSSGSGHSGSSGSGSSGSGSSGSGSSGSGSSGSGSSGSGSGGSGGSGSDGSGSGSRDGH